VPPAANNQMPNEVNPPQPHHHPSTVGLPGQPANYIELFTRATTSNNQRTNVVVATQDRVFSHYVPNSSTRHSKSDSKDRS
jgi:hypothetical protein